MPGYGEAPSVDLDRLDQGAPYLPVSAGAAYAQQFEQTADPRPALAFLCGLPFVRLGKGRQATHLGLQKDRCEPGAREACHQSEAERHEDGDRGVPLRSGDIVHAIAS